MYENIQGIVRVYIVLGLIAFSSCQSNEAPKTSIDQTAKSRVYNPTNGYKKDPVFGRSIHPLICNNDTLITGKPLKLEPTVTSIETMRAPKVIRLSQPLPSENKALSSIAFNSGTAKSTILDSSKLNKRKIGINKTRLKTIVKPKIVKAKIPLLSPSELPIYKGKAARNIKYLDIQQGTSSSYIWDVYQDSRGLIWMGTNGGGVSMYDGSNFRHFNTETGLSSNNVWCINEDGKGNMWFGTWGGGITMYDGNQFSHFGKEQGIINEDIQCIYKDSRENLWIGTNEEIAFYDGETITNVTSNEGLIGGEIRGVVEDAQHRIWVSSNEGISIIEGDSIVNLTTEHGLSSNDISSITMDGFGHIWIGYWDAGVDEFDGTSFTNYNAANFLPHNAVYDVLIDKNNYVWMGTYGGGICHFNQERFIWLNETNGMSGDHVLSLEFDEAGNLWAGTDGDGVNIINLNSFENFHSSSGLKSDYIYSICQDREGRIWFGGEGGEVMSLFNGQFYFYPEFKSISNLTYENIYEDSKGNLWFTTEDSGILKLNGDQLTIYKEENGLSNNIFTSIIEDDSGLMWFGSKLSGIYSFDGKEFRHFKDTKHAGIKSVCKDNNGDLWFGGLNGIIKYDGNSFTRITMKEGLIGNSIVSSFVDSKGNCWFGSQRSGVCMFDGKRFHYFSTKDGLCHNKIWSIIEDTIVNAMWFGTEKGLSEFDLRAFEKSNKIKFTNYSWNDGLRSIDFIGNSAAFDKNGILWWGTGKGLTKLDSKNFSHKLSGVPKLRLKSIYVNDKHFDYRSPHDSLENKMSFSTVDKFENCPKNLALQHDKNHITFHYAGIDWRGPQNIKYSYKIKGLHEHWSHSTKETFADYTNIPYGSYTFMVRAKGSSGSWSKPLEYPFTIHPPWWLTLWAKTIYIVLGMLLVWGIILLRTRNLKIRQFRLVKEIKKATKEIRDKKDEVERQKNYNLEMSKRILEQDKQIILSETANTFAHGLNSPLGAIKAGAEGLHFLYNDLFTNGIKKCSTQQVLFGFEYAKKFNGELFPSGKTIRNRTTKIEEILIRDYHLNKQEAHALSLELNKIFLDSESDTLIAFILKQQNRKEVINLITCLVSFQQITANTLNATEQSSKVVESLKKALKQGRVEEKSDVNIATSISAVLDVLKEDVHKRAQITLSIDNNHVIKNANQYKFFQLWSNMIAILLSGNDGPILIEIRSISKDNFYEITFQTNTSGKQNIFKDSVYDMIMNQQETAFNLSTAVVKNIVEEYKGSIQVKDNKGYNDYVLLIGPVD